MINGEDEYNNRGDPKGTYITFKSWKKLTDCCTRDTKQENDLGNDQDRDSVTP